MNPFQSILCPTDLSACARSALPIACALARDYGARLILLYVRAETVAPVGEFGTLPPEPTESDETLAARMRQSLPPRFAGSVQCVVRTGRATDEILAFARESGCDLIVLGTHGRSALGKLLLGSVAESVLRSAPCPVLTVKPSQLEAAAPAKPVEAAVKADDLATVYSVASEVEAEVIKNALAAEGIRCVLESPQQGGIAGMMSFPVKILVRTADADRATRFLRDHERQRNRANA